MAMLSRFLGRASNTISQLTFSRFIDRQVVRAVLGPDLHQGLAAGRLLGISDRVLGVLDRFAVQFGDYVSSPQTGLVSGRVRSHLCDDGTLHLRRDVQLGAG